MQPEMPRPCQRQEQAEEIQAESPVRRREDEHTRVKTRQSSGWADTVDASSVWTTLSTYTRENHACTVYILVYCSSKLNQFLLVYSMMCLALKVFLAFLFLFFLQK